MYKNKYIKITNNNHTYHKEFKAKLITLMEGLLVSLPQVTFINRWIYRWEIGILQLSLHASYWVTDTASQVKCIIL